MIWFDFTLQGVTSLFHAGLQLEENAPLLVIYKLAEAINILRGFFIFAIFVCKRSVWRKIQLWWKSRGHRGLSWVDSQSSRVTKFSTLSGKSNSASAK